MLLCPSIMCADLNNLKNEINKIDNLIDIYHLDIMDNNFVKTKLLKTCRATLNRNLNTLWKGYYFELLDE